MAKPKYDLETFLRDVELFMKTKLNDKIDEINLEKGDFNLKHVVDKAYIFQTLTEKVNNYSPTIFYHVEDIQSDGIPSSTAELYSIEVVIILSDSQDKLVSYKLLRYLRVLKELFNDNFNSIKYNRKVIVESLTPISFALQNTSNYVDAIGVKISTSIV